MIHLKMNERDLHEVPQSILHARASARSVEGLMDALLPLVGNEDTRMLLEAIRTRAIINSGDILKLYEAIAPQAMGKDGKQEARP